MPPALSDEENSESEGDIAPKLPKAAQNGADDDEEDDGEGEEELYEPEAVRMHVWDDNGILLFEVKWKNYPDAENTWEPEENLADAKEVLSKYFKKIGGRPSQGEKGKKKRRKTEEESTPKSGKGRKKVKTEESIDDDEEDTGTVKRKGKKSDWEPPTGSWEREVNVIESIEEHVDEKTGEMKRWAYVIWNNGKQTKHELRTMNGKAPQKMLQFYEQHLHFKSADARPANGNTTNIDQEAALQEDAAAED